jgi:hypothetical protein
MQEKQRERTRFYLYDFSGISSKRYGFFFWMDGEKVKHTMKRSDMYEMVQIKLPTILKEVYDACNTYSFYMISIPDSKIIHLTPKSEADEQYPDSLNTLMFGKKPHLIKDKKSIQETLMGYGFNPPSDLTVQNLQVLLRKQEPEEEGLISRIFNRRRTPNKLLPKDLTK